MKLVYIHGATADRTTFDTIQNHLGFDDPLYLEYSSHSRFRENLVAMRDALNNTLKDFYIIAHSLGGIYAGHLLESHGARVRGVVSMATPFAGSEIAAWARLAMPNMPLFDDVTPNSWPVTHLKSIKFDVPWTQLVTTTGHVPWLLTRNDGVVTYRSMTSRHDVEYVETECNHYDVMHHKKTVEYLKKSLVL